MTEVPPPRHGRVARGECDRPGAVYRDWWLLGHAVRTPIFLAIAGVCAYASLQSDGALVLRTFFLAFAGLAVYVAWGDLRRWPHTAFSVRVGEEGLSVRLYSGRHVSVEWDQILGVVNRALDPQVLSGRGVYLGLRGHRLSRLGITQMRRREVLICEIERRVGLEDLAEAPPYKRRYLGLLRE